MVKVLEGTGIQSYLLSAHSLTLCSKDYLLAVQRVTYCEFRGLLTLLVKGYLSYLLETLTICLEVYLPLVQIVAYYSLKGLLTIHSKGYLLESVTYKPSLP